LAAWPGADKPASSAAIDPAAASMGMDRFSFVLDKSGHVLKLANISPVSIYLSKTNMSKFLHRQDTPGLPIASVERETGLSKDTLRVWERRYGFPTPGRDANGERQYAPAQVRRLAQIKRLMDRGHRPGKLMAGRGGAAGARRSAQRRVPATPDDPQLETGCIWSRRTTARRCSRPSTARWRSAAWRVLSRTSSRR
jgi:hypothetical protein